MSAYWDTLEAVQAVVSGLPVMSGRTVAMRPGLLLRTAEDTPPCAIVAPKNGEWESVPEIEFADSCIIEYSVLVALVLSNRFDTDQFRWLADAREDVRKALWRATLAGSSLVFDCDYEPNPKGAEMAGLGQGMFASVQQFTFRTKESRI